MAKFRVEVREQVVAYREKYFEAVSEDAAREMAEQDDWRTWEQIEHMGGNDNAIEFIEEVES